MNYKDAIERYVPKDGQEEIDKKEMLECIKLFGDSVLSRDNETAHFVSSAWVMNATRDKVLMVYHKIYGSWMWTGGHSDGERDLLGVAIREAFEETSIKRITPISDEIYMIDIFPVLEHERKGKIVPAHKHLNVTYLLEADEKELTAIQEEENSAVDWIPISEITTYATKEGMRRMGLKLLDRMKSNNLANEDSYKKVL